MNILHENCSLELANDRSLPYTAYLVTYKIDGAICYDIVIPDKQIDIFDFYWDKYREGFKSFKQAEGRVNPRMWGINKNQDKKKR